MPSLNYQYAPSGRPNRSGGASKGRFFLLLIIVTSLMAALIGWFFFANNQEKKKTEQESPAQEELQPETKKPEPKSPEQKTPEKKSPEKIAPEKKDSSGTEISEKIKPVTPAEGDDNLPDSGKGMVLPDDPPEEKDKPQLPAQQNSIDENSQKTLKEIQTLLDGKKYPECIALAEKALESAQENSGLYRELWKILSSARIRQIHNGAPEAGVILHSIRSGDSLGRIADKNQTTIELLKKLNRLSGSRIYVGRKLKVLPGAWKIKVEKSARLLKLYRAEKLYLVFEVGIGRMGKTPTAEFAVSHRLWHPDWYTSDGRIYKYGDPENQLGSCFLKLALFSSPGRPLSGFGIHGCKDESTVGRSLSNGCVRLRNADIELLYHLVPVGSRVDFAE